MVARAPVDQHVRDEDKHLSHEAAGWVGSSAQRDRLPSPLWFFFCGRASGTCERSREGERGGATADWWVHVGGAARLFSCFLL
jgi:hypothetical protein